MAITIEQIQKLREQTAASMSDVKKALEEAVGDEQKAIALLQERGKVIAGKKSSREANDGAIFSYIHQNKRIGVLLSLRCETDFVAKTSEFNALGQDICMHIAAMNPQAIKKEDAQDEEALLNQQFVKDPSKTIEELITGTVAKVGENIVVEKFVRYEV